MDRDSYQRAVLARLDTLISLQEETNRLLRPAWKENPSWEAVRLPVAEFNLDDLCVYQGKFYRVFAVESPVFGPDGKPFARPDGTEFVPVLLLTPAHGDEAGFGGMKYVTTSARNVSRVAVDPSKEG
jgi:hypothetical protein